MANVRFGVSMKRRRFVELEQIAINAIDNNDLEIWLKAAYELYSRAGRLPESGYREWKEIEFPAYLDGLERKRQEFEEYLASQKK